MRKPLVIKETLFGNSMSREIVTPMIVEAWQAGREIEEILFLLQNTYCLAFVFDNMFILKEAGLYERALLCAWTGTRTNYANWSLGVLDYLFQFADPEMLRTAGDPIPDASTFTLYRGVSGRGPARRVNGISWTESPNVAAWFANRFKELGDPAVFRVTVSRDQVMACCNEREESEYLLRLPLPVKPKRVLPMPDPEVRHFEDALRKMQAKQS
ncbi:MAG: hypothetical protein C4576_13785 [Desulfobacteraceae bacterium]|nr:MAG: hypothetical protein C4576_13785 [Desulfobacteraceae bacterium]